MNVYRISLEELASDFIKNPINFVAESDIKVKLVEILKNNLKVENESKTCRVKDDTIKNIPDSYKEDYYKKIQSKPEEEKKEIDRVHTEVSVEKNKRFDVAVFEPTITNIRIRGPNLAKGSKRFEESDLEAAFEVKFIKNKYSVPKKSGGEKGEFDPDYVGIRSDLEALGNLQEVDEKFLAIFSNFNFFFKNAKQKEKDGGDEKIIKRSREAQKKLVREASEKNVDVLYVFPGQERDPWL